MKASSEKAALAAQQSQTSQQHAAEAEKLHLKIQDPTFHAVVEILLFVILCSFLLNFLTSSALLCLFWQDFEQEKIHLELKIKSLLEELNTQKGENNHLFEEVVRLETCLKQSKVVLTVHVLIFFLKIS